MLNRHIETWVCLFPCVRDTHNRCVNRKIQVRRVSVDKTLKTKVKWLRVDVESCFVHFALFNDASTARNTACSPSTAYEILPTDTQLSSFHFYLYITLNYS